MMDKKTTAEENLEKITSKKKATKASKKANAEPSHTLPTQAKPSHALPTHVGTPVENATTARNNPPPRPLPPNQPTPEPQPTPTTTLKPSEPAILPHNGLEAGRAVIHQPFYDGRVRRIMAVDDPEYGNQHHYVMEVQETDKDLGIVRKLHREDIHFQKGPLTEKGPNGWSEGDLVAILVDRFANFENEGNTQPENREILQHLLAAYRTIDKRRKRKLMEKAKV